jgi:hypothetical protein
MFRVPHRLFRQWRPDLVSGAKLGVGMDHKGNGSLWHRVLLAAAFLITCGTLLTPSAASAQFYVRQPDVEKGEIEFEEHGAIYAGPGTDEALRQSHEIEFKRGLTDRFQLIVEGFLEQPIGENLQATEFEIGGQYELIKPQGDGFALAFRTLYSAVKDAPDEILFGPLARYVQGRNSTTLNTFFVGQVGDHPQIDGLEFQYNWQFAHELNHRVAFGVEAFGKIQDLAHPGSFNDQLLRAGPVIYLNFGEEEAGSAAEKHESGETEQVQKSEAPEFKMAAGVLFGMTDATSDVTFKLDAELEF